VIDEYLQIQLKILLVKFFFDKKLAGESFYVSA